MNKSNENVLLSFWLPFRKSNFINSIDSTSRDNLVNKIINFAFDYHLDVKAFDINLTEAEYHSIFQLQETKAPRKQREHVRKHLSGDENIQLTGDIKEQGIKSKDTLTKHKYKLVKKKKKHDDSLSYTQNYLNKYEKSIDVNFSKSEVNNMNHLYLKFKFTGKSMKVFKNFFIDDDRQQFTPSLLTSLEFRLLIDEYGFYFIDVEIYKSTFFEIDYQLIDLFVKMFFSWEKDRFTILTFDQQHIIRDGLLFEYDMDSSNITMNKEEKQEKIEIFFKKIIKVYHFKNFKKQEKFDILPNRELSYILDKRNDNELKQRIYDIPFLNYSYKSNKKNNKLIRKWILNTDKYLSNSKIEFLYKLFLQNQIEKNAINLFLEVSTSINYIGQIINKIKKARDNLRHLITDTTESEEEDEIEESSNKDKLTEEQLARYIEKLFSKIPNLKTIDTFLQEAYYIKVGNYSFISHVEDSENIATLYQYIKWKNLLENIDNTALSLETILQVYQNRQSLEELEELRRNELSTSDKNDVKHISHNDKHNIILDESQKNIFIMLGLVIAFSDFYKELWINVFNFFFDFTKSNFLSTVCSIITAIGIFYIVYKILPIFYKFFFHDKNIISPSFRGINTIELRSKKKLNIQIKHEEDHNFTKNIEQVMHHIEEKIEEPNIELIKMGRKRILFTRVNPRKRNIQIKYIFDEYKGNDFFELKYLGIKKNELFNKNLKIKFFVVYNFVLKLNKEDKNKSKNFFDLYNNSAKIYFNIGVVGNLKKKDRDKIHKDEDFIRQRFYQIFLNQFNLQL